MATEADFLKCVDALNDVTEAFLAARRQSVTWSQYESDRAAFKLMEAVFQNVNAVSGIAVMPKPGSHLVPAWVLLRSAFEISLTASWLVTEDDWKEREARWLGWMKGEEKYQRNIASELRPIPDSDSNQFMDYADQLEQRRRAIMEKLPKDSRDERPSIPEMLRQCGIDRRYYISYRIGSQLTHGGPAVCQELFVDEVNAIRRTNVSYSAWVGPLQMAGWSIAHAGSHVLLRTGATEESIERLVATHDILVSMSSSLQS